MKSVVQNALKSLAIGFLAHLSEQWLKTTFLSDFLRANLITILVAVLAINSGTLGTVLTKIRDLTDRSGGAACFAKTRQEMLLSIREQIGLIIVGTIFLICGESPNLKEIPNLPLLLHAAITGIFAYSLILLYDTAVGVLVIIDFDGSSSEQ